MFFFSRIYFTIFSCKPRFHTTNSHTHILHTPGLEKLPFSYDQVLYQYWLHISYKVRKKKKDKKLSKKIKIVEIHELVLCSFQCSIKAGTFGLHC